MEDNLKEKHKKVKKQSKDLNNLYEVIEKLASGQELDVKYRNHDLITNKKYIYCKECHIESDWLLIYQIIGEKLILLLFVTGSHSELFK